MEGVEQGFLNYCTALFEVATIERVVERLVTLLQSVVKAPVERPICDLPMAAADEIAMLDSFNWTHNDFPKDTCVHQLVDAQAAFSPNRIALEFEPT